MVPSHSKESDVDMKDPQTLIGLLQTELSTTNHEVMLLTLELEQRVAERMAQLSETNAELVKEIAERRRAEEEVKELNRESVDLNAIVDSVIRDHNAEVQGRNVVWKHTQLPGAWGDVALLRQVVVNLISNALKYSRLSNPAEIEISVLENDSGETVFFVRDNGVGFDSQHADK